MPRKATIWSALAARRTTIFRHARVAAACVPLAFALSASAQSFDEDFDDAKKPWQEIAIQLPPPPAKENLIRFDAGPTATQVFELDANSLTVGTDGVIRYTLVTSSSAGAENVSYEGIRCQSFEKKLYAFGRSDGSWGRSRRDKWERIQTGKANGQHASLAQDYFCENLTIAGNAQDMLERMRMRRPLTNNFYR
jgi:hypothetical protein